jgi:hypothetical protein
MDYRESSAPASLARLFGGEPYRFAFHLRPATAGWFDRAGACPERLAERRAALESAQAPGFHWSPAADPAWQALARWAPDSLGISSPEEVREPQGAARELAGNWAPDFLLLRREPTTEKFRFVGGAVCFPSAWDPANKLGRTLAEIHAPAPTLNATLGERIERFLRGLRPGEVFERENWGLSAAPDLRYHPALERPRFGAAARLEDVWFRLEEQALVLLPGGLDLVFLIHVRVWPVPEVLALPGLRPGLIQALRSMPEAIAEYKGLGAVRNDLIRQMEG